MVRKIADIKQPKPCTHPEHNFPNMIVLPPGIYEHICPRCGKAQIIHIGKPSWSKSFTLNKNIAYTYDPEI